MSTLYFALAPCGAVKVGITREASTIDMRDHERRGDDLAELNPLGMVP